MTAWPSRDRGRGSRGVILVVWRCPDGCAQAAGIHIMGVVQVHQSRRYPSYGHMGGSITWGSPVWAWQGPGGPGEGGRSSSGQGNVDSWEVRCKADPSRAGPGSSNVREQREGEGNVLLAGSTGQLQWRKVAQGQVHKMPHLVFISSFRTIVRN